MRAAIPDAGRALAIVSGLSNALRARKVFSSVVPDPIREARNTVGAWLKDEHDPDAVEGYRKALLLLDMLAVETAPSVQTSKPPGQPGPPKR